jgi:hypothetical protein
MPWGAVQQYRIPEGGWELKEEKVCRLFDITLPEGRCQKGEYLPVTFYRKLAAKSFKI